MTSDAPHGRIGIELPDRRGRTGLDQAGRDLQRNERVRVRDVRLLSSNWYVTRATTIDYQRADGTWDTIERETYDRGDGACMLLYDADARTVLLIRQFRYPAYVNEHPDGMLLELPAGLLDDDDAHTAIRREVEEEVGYRVSDVRFLFDAYMSPGSVTERLHFFTGAYRSGDIISRPGSGVAEEGEDIEVVEMRFEEALAGIGSEIRDAKTIMMLQWAAISGPFATAPRVGKESE